MYTRNTYVCMCCTKIVKWPCTEEVQFRRNRLSSRRGREHVFRSARSGGDLYGLRRSTGTGVPLPREQSDGVPDHSGRRERRGATSVRIRGGGRVRMHRHAGSDRAPFHHRSPLCRVSSGRKSEGYRETVLQRRCQCIHSTRSLQHEVF